MLGKQDEDSDETESSIGDQSGVSDGDDDTGSVGTESGSSPNTDNRTKNKKNKSGDAKKQKVKAEVKAKPKGQAKPKAKAESDPAVPVDADGGEAAPEPKEKTKVKPKKKRKVKKRRKRPPPVPGPFGQELSVAEIYKMFSLSTTNQILRGISPVPPGLLSPRPPVPEALAKAKGEAKVQAEAKKREWMELIASELMSAQVSVVPKPMEGDVTRVPRDPRKGLYLKAQEAPAPAQEEHLCKAVRRRLIRDIIHKHRLIFARPRVDSGYGRKLPSKKQLEVWKFKRASNLEPWRSLKKRRRGGASLVVGTKVSRRRKRAGGGFFSVNSRCQSCGDYHFRRNCGGGSRAAAGDMAINLMVRQIMQKTDVIKQHMGEAWQKLESLEDAYQGMMMRVHLLQSNRVCLRTLTGQDYPGESHPDNCPCTARLRQEKLDAERQEQLRKVQEEERRTLEAKREVDRVRREQMLDYRKKRYYSRLRAPLPSDGPGMPRSSPDGPVQMSQKLGKASGEGPLKKMALMASTSAEAGGPPRFRASGDLVVMDGKVKSLSSHFTEDGGLIRESLSVESVVSPEPQLPPLRDEVETPVTTLEIREDLETAGEDSTDEGQTPRSNIKTGRSVTVTPFSEILDVLEIF